jgi:hypothetical protein
VARELTEEDWKSEEAKESNNLLLFLTVVPGLIFGFVSTIVLEWGVLVSVCGIVLVMIGGLFNDEIIFLLPGAYQHYRKRIAGAKE